MNKNNAMVLAMLLWVGLTAGAAVGQVSVFDFSPPWAGGNGDITIDFAGQFTGVQILLELSQGTINYGPEFLPVTLAEGETFVAVNNVPQPLAGVPIIPGGAVDLGGGAALSVTPTLFDIAASLPDSAMNANNRDQTGFIIGRVGVSDDAVGTLKVLASANGQIATRQYLIPEPSTLLLLGLAGLGLACRRRVSVTGR